MTPFRDYFSGKDDGQIKTWRHGEFPMPEWVRQSINSNIEPNGTFTILADLGCTRVHLGDVVVEHDGALWVRPLEEAVILVNELKIASGSQIMNVGPGRARQFGAAKLIAKSKVLNYSKLNYKMKFSSISGAPPSIEWIQLDLLSVDAAYQRTTENEASRRLIASIAAKFDWRLCAPLIVSRREDETLKIIDGQHRWMAASLRNDIPHMPCCIFRYGNMQEEARMFILANRARKPMNRLDDYFAALAAADEDALEIQQLVEDAGLSIARNTSSSAWRPGEIAFTASIANAIRRFGPSITSAVLTNMAEAFPGQKLTHGGAIFGGLIKIMSGARQDFDPDHLMTVLQAKTADDWGAFASGLKGGEVRVNALYDAILIAYNHQAPGEGKAA